MEIIPQKPIGSVDAELLPIKVILQNRADLLAVMLRFFRYLYQRGIGGENLLWRDGSETGIWIEDAFPEHPIGENQLPIISVDIGGIIFGGGADPMYPTGGLFDGRSGSNIDNFSKSFTQSVPVSLEIRGRNKLETFFISELTAAMLVLLTPELRGSVDNLQDIQGVNVSNVMPLGNPGKGVGDSPFIFRSTIGFTATYTVDYHITKQGLYGGSPLDPQGGGLNLGSDQTQTNETGEKRGLFTFADFHVTSRQNTNNAESHEFMSKIIIPDMLKDD